MFVAFERNMSYVRNTWRGASDMSPSIFDNVTKCQQKEQRALGKINEWRFAINKINDGRRV